MIGPITAAPLRFFVLIVEELLPQLCNNRITQCVSDNWIWNVQAFLIVSLFQNPRNSIVPSLGLGCVSSSFSQSRSELIKFYFTCQLTVDANNDAIVRFKILH